MKNEYWITNATAVDFAMKIKIGEVCWVEGSTRPDDQGSIFVAPVCRSKWNSPLGLVLIYLTTNGDPVAVGQIQDEEVIWFEESNQTPGFEVLKPILERANWILDPKVEDYSFLVKESLLERI